MVIFIIYSLSTELSCAFIHYNFAHFSIMYAIQTLLVYFHSSRFLFSFQSLLLQLKLRLRHGVLIASINVNQSAAAGLEVAGAAMSAITAAARSWPPRPAPGAPVGALLVAAGSRRDRSKTRPGGRSLGKGCMDVGC